VFNSGSGREIAIGDLARLLCEITGRDAEVVQEQGRLRPAASEVMRLLGDTTRLREATGWTPAHDLREGLSITAEWFARPENLARYKWDRYTL
jgi:nucleoside-diphosphate-sugar epimerase